MDPIRDKPLGPSKPPYSRWQFYAKWWHQGRKAPAGQLSRYALTEPVQKDRAERRFYGFATMKNYHSTARFTFFLRSNQRWRPRPYAGKLRLPPARWI